ncbi:MAG TPA: AraC family transcriptional regulator [Planctomycetota bacterium]|nr:AraC family transcriptional regulator [Planctomycetota bacterium]
MNNPPHAPLVVEMIGFDVRVYPKKSDEQHWPVHLHSFYQLDVTLAGEVFVELDEGGRIRCTRGTGLLIPPAVRHGHSTWRGFTSGMFKFRIAPQYWSVLGKDLSMAKLPPQALKAVSDAAAACSEHHLLAANEADAALTLCLAQICRADTTRPEPVKSMGQLPELWRLLEKVERDPFAAWTVAKLARQCHVTPDHFSRMFRAALDQTPQEYLTRTRIRAAAAQLTGPRQMAVKEVAELAGYSTVHAFTRTFRRVMGVGPGAYRRMKTDL